MDETSVGRDGPGDPPDPALVRTHVFGGSRVTYRLSPKAASFPTQAMETGSALPFAPRASLFELVDRDVGLSLCGRDAPPCPP